MTFPQSEGQAQRSEHRWTWVDLSGRPVDSQPNLPPLRYGSPTAPRKAGKESLSTGDRPHPPHPAGAAATQGAPIKVPPLSTEGDREHFRDVEKMVVGVWKGKGRDTPCTPLLCVSVSVWAY